MNKQLRNKQFFWWCIPLFGVSLFCLYAAMAYSKLLPVYALETDGSNAASVARLEDWRFYPDALQLEITLSAASQPRYFYLAQPPRIVVDLAGTKLGYVPTQQNYSGAIQSIRVSQFNADVTRIVMDLAPGTFLDPNQVQLQPVSWQNPTRWVLRPLIAGNRTSFPQGNFQFQPSNLAPGIYNNPQPPSNLAPGIYNSPQPPSNLPPTTDNNPQPPSNLAPGIYNNPQPPSNLAPGIYNNPQPPSNLAPGIYNNPQPPSNLAPGIYNSPQPPAVGVQPTFTTLPPTTSNNQQPPFVSVPPLSPNNASQLLPSPILPPANFPTQPGNFNNSVPPLVTPNFPVPVVPNYPPGVPNSGVIEFGQPFPNSTR